VIAHVDCTAADNINRPLCDAQGVNGFPTLIIYKDGVKVGFTLVVVAGLTLRHVQVEEYNGKRDLAELEKFVEKHLAAAPAPAKEIEKDEL